MTIYPSFPMKRVLIIIAGIVALLVVAFFVLRTVTKSNSPAAVAEFKQNGFTVDVNYCRPYKKGRAIFGGLVPYGQVWRTGANEATTITFGQDVSLAGQPLKAGTYTLWSIPSQQGWIVIINGETGQWGTNYDQKRDVLRVPVSTRPHTPPAEQFDITFTPDGNGTNMLLSWDTTEAIVPIRKP